MVNGLTSTGWVNYGRRRKDRTGLLDPQYEFTQERGYKFFYAHLPQFVRILERAILWLEEVKRHLEDLDGVSEV